MRRLLRTVMPKTACDEFETDLVLYAYGKIGDVERASIEAHLDACASCRARQDRLLEELATAPLDFPPPQFWDDYSRELRQKLAAIDEGRRNGLRWLPPLSFGGITAMAAGFVVVIALGMSLQHTLFSSRDDLQEEAAVQEDAMMEVLPIVQNLEFFESMHYLELMDQDTEGKIKSSDIRNRFGVQDLRFGLAEAETSGCTAQDRRTCGDPEGAAPLFLASISASLPPEHTRPFGADSPVQHIG